MLPCSRTDRMLTRSGRRFQVISDQLIFVQPKWPLGPNSPYQLLSTEEPFWNKLDTEGSFWNQASMNWGAILANSKGSLGQGPFGLDNISWSDMFLLVKELQSYKAVKVRGLKKILPIVPSCKYCMRQLGFETHQNLSSISLQHVIHRWKGLLPIVDIFSV